MKIVGIDLGTTNSCVSVMLHKKARVIENSEGSRTTPSIVAYKDNEILVGQRAKRQSTTNPKNTFFAVKRLIGRKFNDLIVQNDIIKKVPYSIIKSPINEDAWVSFNGKGIAPPQVSAQILLKMKKTVEDFLGEKVDSAVITVPAYFNDMQRQATKDAGKIAGLDVRRIINEPTAAALAYGIEKKKKDQTVVVYDLGGGTFDISVIEISNVDGDNQIEVLSTNGNTFLGGEDFDLCLINHLINVFLKEEGIDLHADKLALQRIREAAEKAKIELSSSLQTDINLPYLTADNSGPKHLNHIISRSKYESLVNNLIESSLKPCKKALEDAKLTIENVTDVLLVGGQTRMPKIQNIVESFFKMKPRKDINPDEAVAVGAAIQAGVISGDVKDILLLDVTPLSLGIETMGGIMTRVIERNTTIPIKKSQIFSTAEDNQRAVTIHILQGERNIASANKSLGRFDLTGISPSPRGIPQIEVSFDLDTNGILNVFAKDKETQKEHKIIIKASGGLSEKEIDRMITDSEKNSFNDKKYQELIKIKNEAETKMYEINKMVKDNKNSISNENKEKISSKIELIKKFIKDNKKEEIESATNELNQLHQQIVSKLNKNSDNSNSKDKNSNNSKQ